MRAHLRYDINNLASGLSSKAYTFSLSSAASSPKRSSWSGRLTPVRRAQVGTTAPEPPKHPPRPALLASAAARERPDLATKSAAAERTSPKRVLCRVVKEAAAESHTLWKGDASLTLEAGECDVFPVAVPPLFLFVFQLFKLV